MMVATKRSPQADVSIAHEKRSGTAETGPNYQDPLGGFIFVCNNDTMNEDFERHLFGLPQRYHDSVKAIQPGLPLFLYNYSTRCLHGVFEASSDGGLNIEPDAWGEKELRKNGRQPISRFPAQVRVRWREERPPLEEEKFRPVLYHYDGPKFRLQLSQSEAQTLLKLFGASPMKKVEETHEELPQEDSGGEWERVKSKNKTSRPFRAPPPKRSTSPNSAGGRKRGSVQNGVSVSGGGPPSNISTTMQDKRGRDRDNRADTAQRWRSDSDSWSGSSSAGTVNSSWGSHEEEKPKRGPKENGSTLEINGACNQVSRDIHDLSDGAAYKSSYHANGSNDKEAKVDLRNIEDSNESSSSQSTVPEVSNRPSFLSYSAALKSRMLPSIVAENGHSSPHSLSSENGNSPSSSTSNESRRSSYSSVANMPGPSPSSPVAILKGSTAVDKAEGSEQKFESAGNRNSAYLEEGYHSHSKTAVPDKEIVGVVANEEMEARREERPQPWGKTPTVGKSNTLESRNGSTAGFSTQGSDAKILPQTPLFQQSRPIHDPRQQFVDHQNHEKQEERAPFRKQIQLQEHPQHPSSMLHSPQQQLGQGLMPLCIPIPPPPVHHHALLSAVPPATSLYRDRPRIRSGNGSVDSPHGLAYRAVSRNMLEGELNLQSPMLPGNWSPVPPMMMMGPFPSPIAGSLTFPLPPPHVLINAESLHAEILEFARTARPPAQTRVLAEAAVECVRDSVKQLWPGADVEVFGSFATGLCLPQSDVDVVVVDAPPPLDTPETASLSGARLLTPLIRALSGALKDYEWCESLNTIDTASMPVIKLRWRPSNMEEASCESPVAIDITIGGRKSDSFAGVVQPSSSRDVSARKPLNPKFEAARNAHNGAAAREFVIERLRQLSALAPLVLLLKSFLQLRGLNDVYSGGLGSFALTLMLVFYLERIPILCGTPQEVPLSVPLGTSPVSNSKPSNLSVDISQSMSTAADSVDSSDDESSDSSVLTNTSASSTGSLEPALAPGSSCGDVTSSCNGEPIVKRTGIVEELLASMHTVASPNLGILLVGFLHVFGQEIDFSRVRLVLKGKNGSPGGVFWHEKNARTLPLWIDDPLRPDANIGAGSFNIWQVQAAMRDMLYVITRPQTLPGPLPLSNDRVGKGPGRRRPLPLLDQLFVNNVPPAS